MKEISNPHDKLFRETWSNRELATDFLGHYLPDDVLKRIDLRTLEICKDTFIEKELRDFYSDLLYKVGITCGGVGYVHVLFEHKSYPDRLTPLQVLEYEIGIWRLHLKQQPAKKPRSLPIIIPVVLYHGETKWNFGDTFSNLFADTEPALSGFIPNFKYVLLDLTQYADDEIRGAVMCRVAMLLFKYVTDADFVKKLPGILSLLQELSESGSGLAYIEKFLRYLFSTMGNMSPDELKAIVEQSAMRDKGGLVMTLAEQLRNEGYQQGIQQGIELALSVRFGNVGLKMMEKIRDIRDVEKLKSITKLVQTTDNLADIEKTVDG